MKKFEGRREKGECACDIMNKERLDFCLPLGRHAYVDTRGNLGTKEGIVV